MPRKKEDLTAYSDRVKRVISYMHEHLDEKITVDHLADIACMSPFHWQRIYHKIQGETLSGTLRRLRLHRASYFLAHSDLKVRDIAGMSGYVNHQSFGRAFQAAYDQSPSQFRENQSSQARRVGQDHLLWPVAIEHVPCKPGYATLHEDEVVWIGKTLSWLSLSLQKFGILDDDIDAHHAFGLYQKGKPGMAMIANDLPIAPVDDLSGVFHRSFGGCTYAIIHYRGPYAGLEYVHRWFNRTWLPQSEYQRQNGRVVEEYLDDPTQNEKQIMNTKIYWPVARQN